MTALARLDKLDNAIAADEVLRGAWRTERDGRELGCLLVTLAPECGSGDVGDCPAEVMPVWLAHLTPWIDDAGSLTLWPSVVRRYAAALRRCASWTPERWHRAEYAVRALCVREAMRHTTEAPVLAVCERVVLLCEREARGETVEREEFATAEASAAAESSAWSAASWAAAWAAASAAAAAAADRVIEGVLVVLEGER